MKVIKRLFVEERAQGLTEYALIVAVVVFVIYAAISAGGFGDSINGILTKVASKIAAVAP